MGIEFDLVERHVVNMQRNTLFDAELVVAVRPCEVGQ